MRRYSRALSMGVLLVVGLDLSAQPNMVRNGGFEEGSAFVTDLGWTFPEGAVMEGGDAFEGKTYIRIKTVGKPTTASAVTSDLITVVPNSGYVARCRYRLSGTSAHVTFGVVDEGGAFIACRDFYAGVKPYWSEAVLPFRTERHGRLGVYAGRRYGQGEVLFDAIELVADDSVRVGDVSTAPNAMPAPTEQETQRGYILSSRPWLTRVAPSDYPTREETEAPIACRLTPGEYEPVTFAATALGDLNNVRVTVESGLNGPDGWRIPAHQVSIGVVRCIKRWLTNSAPLKPGQRFERLPLFIFPNQPVAIPTGETQRFWLTIHVPPGTPPGTYSGRVRVAPAGRPPADLPLQADVLPFELVSPDVTYGMYYRHAKQDKEFITEQFFRRTLTDMKAHGMNSFSVYADLSAKGAAGTLGVNLDGGDAYHYKQRACGLNWQMRILRETGLLDRSHPLLLLADYRFTTNVELIKAFSKACQTTWPEFLLYLVDEPHTPEQIEQAKRLNAIAHTIPGVRTTTAIAQPGELADSYDVWIVSTSTVEFEKTCQLAREKAREMWAYNCIWNGSQPLNDRYYSGLFTWTAGLRGNWQWCYTEDTRGSSDFNAPLRLKIPYYADPWYATYLLATPEATIPTTGWEARREGIDDYRYLLTLSQAIERAEASGGAGQKRTAREARRFLEEASARARRPPAVSPAALPERTYRVLYHPGLQADDYDAIRRRAADLVVRLQNADPE